MSSSSLALLAAVSAAIAALFTKRMVGSFPARQLIGPLLGLNGLLVAPFLFTAHWHFSTSIVLIQLASTAALIVSSGMIFELFVHGSASAVATGSAMAPIPAVVFTALLLSTPVTWTQGIAAAAVSLAVLVALGTSFGELSPARAISLVAGAATLSGLLLVLTKMLTNRGVGLAEIYSTRTFIGAAVWIAIAPPRDLPLRVMPQLFFRSSFQTGYFALMILAVERGSPATVQTLAATTPLMLLVPTMLIRRHTLSPRLLFASVAVVAGVALTLRP